MKPRSDSDAQPPTFEACMAAFPPDKRAALEQLRKTIHSAAPGAEECVSYGLPAFRLNGKFLVAIGAAAKHCAFYVGSTLRAHRVDLRGYDTSTGTIRFDARTPLPAALVRQLVKSRIAQQSQPKQKPAPARPRKSRARKPA